MYIYIYINEHSGHTVENLSAPLSSRNQTLRFMAGLWCTAAIQGPGKLIAQIRSSLRVARSRVSIYIIYGINLGALGIGFTIQIYIYIYIYM